VLPKPDLTGKSRLELHGSARGRVPPALSRNSEEGRVRNGVEPKVIKMLEDAVKEARRGEIIAAAIVLARPNEDKCSGASAAAAGDMRYLVAACDYLKRDIIAETDN
jgi:hypothetical protein